MRIGFIGAGTVGTALTIGLSTAGYTVSAVTSRSLSSAERLARVVNEVDPASCTAMAGLRHVAVCCGLVFITTPDDAIVDVAAQVVGRRGQAVVHCSGALSNEDLGAIVGPADVGGFRPLQSFACAEDAVRNLRGSAFGIEATGSLREVLGDMAIALGSRRILLKPGHKAIYHASALIVSNYTVTLMKLAADLWAEMGLACPEATEALQPLARGTVDNISRTSSPGCRAGPIARGDCGTVQGAP